MLYLIIAAIENENEIFEKIQKQILNQKNKYHPWNITIIKNDDFFNKIGINTWTKIVSYQN